MAKQFISGQEVKESKVEAIIFTGIPTLTKKHPTSLHPLKFPAHSKSTSLGAKPLTHELWGTFKKQTRAHIYLF
jgi:hypothetical protein